MWFKNLQTYRLPRNWSMTADALAEQLAGYSFTPASSNELLREGWAPPRPDGGLVHSVNGQFLIKLQTEKKLLPATVINQVAAARAAEMEEAQGFAPGKKAMKELKERVADELLPRAFPIAGATHVWIDPKAGWLVVDAASPTKADEVIKLLLKSVDRMPLESLRVQRSVVGAMTGWLQDDEAPAGFTVDQDAILRATGESRAQVAYKKHTLEPDDVRRHIAAGKQCTRLAMTWDSKISFVLDESLAIKAVRPLDVLTETDKDSPRNDDERFDGDFALMAGELAKLLADLVVALGGEAAMDAPGEPKGAPVSTAPAKHAEQVQAQSAADPGDVTVPPGDGSASDPLSDHAVRIVRANQRASISLIQRHLRVGYNRAARLLEAMEIDGLISAQASDGTRRLLPKTAAP